MPSSLILGLRAAQTTCAFILLGLSASVAHWYMVDAKAASPSQINWLLVCSVYTIISVLYLELSPRFMPKLCKPFIAVSVEAVNTLFCFAGFIALSVFISQLLFCRGNVCATAKASVAFAAFEFLLWSASTFLMAREVFKGSSIKLPNIRRPGAKAPLSVTPMKEAVSEA